MLHGLHPSYFTEETEELTINNMRILFIYSCKYYESFSDPDQVVECVCISFPLASPAVISMWCCTLKLDEEKSKCAGLAQENGFGSA